MKKNKTYACMVVFFLAMTSSLYAANLVAQWKLNEGTGLVAPDSTGHGYDGQLGDFALEDFADPIWVGSYADPFGITRGPILEFDGKDFSKKYVNLNAHVSSFSGLMKGTISAFFKKDLLAEAAPGTQNVSNNQVIFSMSDNTQDSVEWVMTCEQGVVRIVARGGTGNIDLRSGPVLPGEDVGITDGCWHHAAVTVDAIGVVKLYVDGVEKANAAGGQFLKNIANPTNMAIGRNQDNKTTPEWAFDGLLSDVRVYDDALSAAEISAMIPLVGEIIQSGGTTAVTEGAGTDTFNIVLNKAPTATVTVTINPTTQLNVGNGVGVAKNLTFNSTNWSTPQTVTVTANDDSDPEGDIKVKIACLVSSSDTAFNNGWLIGHGVEVTVYDNDNSNAALLAHWKLDSNNQIVTDSSGHSYHGILGSTLNVEPNDPNLISSYTDGLLVTRGPALEFDGTYYSKKYVNLDSHVNSFAYLSKGTIAIFFKQDRDQDDPTVQHINNQVLFSISDNTVPASDFRLQCAANKLQAQTRNFEISTLTMESDVDLKPDGLWHHAALTVNSLGAANLYLDGILVDATSGGFFDTISYLNSMAIGVNDDDGEGKQWGFDGLISDVRIYDDALMPGEVRALVPLVGSIAESNGLTQVTEGGATDSINYVLSKKPNSDVTVTLHPTADLDLGQGTGVVKVLTFNSGNWNVPQVMTVRAVDDAEAESTEQVLITYTISSTDAAFNNGWTSPRSTVVTIHDNECGEWGYKPMDFNKDCYVNFKDFVAFALQWSKCTVPDGIGCNNMNQ